FLLRLVRATVTPSCWRPCPLARLRDKLVQYLLCTAVAGASWPPPCRSCARFCRPACWWVKPGGCACIGATRNTLWHWATQPAHYFLIRKRPGLPASAARDCSSAPVGRSAT